MSGNQNSYQSKNGKSRVSREDAVYVHGLVKRICDEVGPGISCSPQENSRGEIIRDELLGIVGPESVEKEEFSCSPRAMFGWFRAVVVLTLISVWLQHVAIRGYAPQLTSLCSFLIASLVLSIVLLEFVFYREFIDSFFPEKKSHNIIGKMRKKSGKAPSRIFIIAGHHDSAIEFNWIRLLKYGYYIAVVMMFWTIFGVFIHTALYETGCLFDIPRLRAIGRIDPDFLILPLAPGLFFAFFFLGSTKNGGKVPGAVDNLTGSCLALGVGRILKRYPELIPENVEVRLISFGSEEAGLRGSKRYVAKHLRELQEKDAVICNLETIIDPKLIILTSDINGLVKNSPEIINQFSSAAEKADVPCIVRPFPFGGGATDAGSFSKAGLKSVCILGMHFPRQMVKFYHQRYDSPEILNITALENTLKLVVKWFEEQPDR